MLQKGTSDIFLKLLHVGLGPTSKVSVCWGTLQHFSCKLRSSILDLAQSFENAQGWASERIFSRWVNKQEWRKCLPPIFELCEERVACLRHMAKTTFY